MFDYKKKFYFVVLSTLLLTLLLGLCGSCYAIELGQVKNLVYNAMVTGNGVSESDARIKITDYDYWDTIESYCNDSYQLVAGRTSTTGRYEFYFEPSSYNTQLRVYTYNGEIRSDLYAKRNLQFSLSGSTFNSPPTSWASPSSTHLRVYDLYSESDIYTYNTENILYHGPYSEPSWFDTTGDYYSEIVWNFIANGSTVTLENDNQWPFRLITGGWGIDFGSISDSEWVNKISYRVAYWNKGLNKFGAYGNNYVTIYDYSKNGPLYSYWPGTTTNANGIYTTRITLDNYNYQNCLMQIKIESSIPGELPTKYIDYYIESSNTVVQNGVVITSSIFSGDYIGDYDNQQQENQNNDNTDKIVDTVTDDSQVDDILDGYFSGDYNDMANQWGFNPFQNPYYDFLKSVLFGICDVLADQRNVTLDISFFGRSIVLHSEDFITPNNLITQFVRYVLIFFYIYGCFKFFYSVIISFETADIETIKQKIGTDEFYYKDGKYM